MSCARSNAAPRRTVNVRSAKISGPLRRNRSRANILDSRHPAGRGGDLVVQPRRDAVQEIVDRFFAEPDADRDDDHRDAQGGHGVGPLEPGK